MTRMIFINLPVRDLGPSGAFYRALGGTVNGLFSDEQATCVMFSDTIGVMLLTHERYSQFTSRPIGDARAQSQALLALSVETREEVDTAITAAVAAGGRADPNPVQDLGFMYGRSAEDPDGNVWEILWMDPAAAESGPPAG
ncbi:MAG TPA: lactoylglutathione lyase [Rhizobium sp.]|nr:lactoylglutathione lyase [Rhizobium sp.]